MQAWQAHEYGPFRDVLALDEIPDPEPPPGGAVIAVRAAGINFPDILAIAGRYQVKAPLPFVPGTEAAGEVVAVGEGSAYKPGDRIIAMNLMGAFAEKMTAFDAMSYPIPEAMGDDHAAAFLMTYQTSYFALHHRASLQPGETVLVHGGAGGVGTAAIQLAKAHGATVIATAGSAEKLDVCRRCGADHVINYREEDFVGPVKEITQGRGADVIYDPVGGDVFDRSTKCIAWEGRLVVIGFASGRIPDIAANRILLKNIAVTGLFWGNYQMHRPELIDETQRALYELYERGAIEPVIYDAFPLAELPAALAAIEERRSYGKVLLKP